MFMCIQESDTCKIIISNSTMIMFKRKSFEVIECCYVISIVAEYLVHWRSCGICVLTLFETADSL